MARAAGDGRCQGGRAAEPCLPVVPAIGRGSVRACEGLAAARLDAGPAAFHASTPLSPAPAYRQARHATPAPP